MRTWLPLLLAALVVTAVRAQEAPVTPPVGPDELVPEKYRKYQEVEFSALKVAPEDLKNKKICYVGRLVDVGATFFPYMEKSGFKADHDLLIGITEWKIPVIVEKKDDWVKLFGDLKRGAKLKVYGKLREFRVKPQDTILPHYFLDLEYVLVLPVTPVSTQPVRPIFEHRRAPPATGEQPPAAQ